MRGSRPFALLVAASLAILLGLLAALAWQVGRPYPGFFHAIDYRVFPVERASREAGLAHGDRIVTVDGRSPLTLAERLRETTGPIRYEVERAGRRFTVDLAPAPFTASRLVDRFGLYFVVSAVMLAVGALVFAQNPTARPNRNFLVYMCLWAVSNAAVPEAVMGPDKYGATFVGFVAVLLPVHGWIFFLTYPSNPAREAWLVRHRVAPRLYRAALALGVLFTLTFLVSYVARPEWLAEGTLYRASLNFQVFLAVISFPIKIAALLDTRRRAGSPLVNQQTTVLLLGIGFGLGLWLVLMLGPLAQLYEGPVDPQVGSALVLLYPAAIAYATVRYRLFDATVVIRRSVVYTALAGLITGAYALLIAGANALLAQADLVRSPWFSAGFMFLVVLAFNPLRERVRRAVDRTFFRERYDYARTIQALARSMRSLLDLDEIMRRLTTTIESAMHVSGARLTLGAPAPGVSAVLATAPGALSRYQVAADPRFSPLGAAGAWRVGGARRRGRGAAPLPGRAARPPAPRAQAVGGRLHRRGPRAPRDAGRPGRGGGGQCRGAPSGARLRAPARAEPPHPHHARQVRAAARARADRGVTRGALARQARDRRLGALRRHHRLHAPVLPPRPRRPRRPGRALLRRLPRRDREARRRRERDGRGRAHGDLPRGRARPRRGGGGARHPRAAPRSSTPSSPRASTRSPCTSGINTGPALLGATKMEGRAGTRWTYTASGLTTNIAARLAALAKGGEIVVSEETRARLDPDVAAEDLGIQPLKNVERPVRAFRLR